MHSSYQMQLAYLSQYAWQRDKKSVKWPCMHKFRYLIFMCYDQIMDRIWTSMNGDDDDSDEWCWFDYVVPIFMDANKE